MRERGGGISIHSHPTSPHHEDIADFQDKEDMTIFILFYFLKVFIGNNLNHNIYIYIRETRGLIMKTKC